MPKDKACGPDGLSIDFFLAFWQTIKVDTTSLISFIFETGGDVRCLNKATITLIPKKQAPEGITDYRSISVINMVIKIATKIMANILQPHLQDLVDKTQTAFVKGRSMMEFFLMTRELLTFCSKQKLPAVLYNVDFEKTFDTVDWCFMINLLIERGFLSKWLSAIMTLLCSSSSSVKFNGAQIRHITHMRGLRQGDPLSPMLFILIADSLSRFMFNA